METDAIDDVDLMKRRFFATAIGDGCRALRGRSLVGTVTLAVCVVDALGHLSRLVPEGGIGKNFVAWADRWIVPLRPSCDASALYAVRCGLVHTYGLADAMTAAGIDGYTFVHSLPGRHWTRSHGTVILNVESVLAETVVAAADFFAALRVAPNQDIIDRAGGLITLRTAPTWDERLPSSFAEMDPVLALFDSHAVPEILEFENALIGLNSEP